MQTFLTYITCIIKCTNSAKRPKRTVGKLIHQTNSSNKIFPVATSFQQGQYLFVPVVGQVKAKTANIIKFGGVSSTGRLWTVEAKSTTKYFGQPQSDQTFETRLGLIYTLRSTLHKHVKIKVKCCCAIFKTRHSSLHGETNLVLCILQIMLGALFHFIPNQS